MTKIYNTITDQFKDGEILTGYENGGLNQWLLYTNQSALVYYDGKDNFYDENATLITKDFINFGKKHCIEKGKKTVMVSIGCGNSGTEKECLLNLGEGYDVSYIGVDTSEEMLKLTEKNFKDTGIQRQLIRADFSSDFFLKEINNYTKGYNNVIFVFFGGTFGNIK
ncbi:MAG: hypothetical protein GY828_05850, partial [Candidatus Gracilibacteria bacterium]|nr:hypothetical protein [Candidatus Gracilibacteria bacterium]